MVRRLTPTDNRVGLFRVKDLFPIVIFANALVFNDNFLCFVINAFSFQRIFLLSSDFSICSNIHIANAGFIMQIIQSNAFPQGFAVRVALVIVGRRPPKAEFRALLYQFLTGLGNGYQPFFVERKDCMVEGDHSQ